MPLDQAGHQDKNTSKAPASQNEDGPQDEPLHPSSDPLGKGGGEFLKHGLTGFRWLKHRRLRSMRLKEKRRAFQSPTESACFQPQAHSWFIRFGQKSS